MGILNVPKRERNLSKMAYLAKSPLWDDASCHYNPVASYFYRTHECETLYTQCVFSDDTCSWATKMTREYRLCYEAREEVWRRRNVIRGLACPETQAALQELQHEILKALHWCTEEEDGKEIQGTELCFTDFSEIVQLREDNTDTHEQLWYKLP